MKRYTEKRGDKYVIPLKNTICGIDIPKWKITTVSDNEMYLEGEAVDKLAKYEDEEELHIVSKGDILYLAYTFRHKEHIGKFEVSSVHINEPKFGMTSWVRLRPIYRADEIRIESMEGYPWYDVNLKGLSRMLRTVNDWRTYIKEQLTE